MSNQSESSRILKNTISLYIRMIVLTVISLFTVRIVLKVLGAEDYGLYNVVGGFVSMFAFLSGTLTISSQRYFAICLADDDWKELNKYFSVNFCIYILFVFIIVIFSETFGLWFVMNKMVIPTSRMTACLIVYQLSIFTFVVGLLVSPFLALLVADENLSIYSIVSIVEGIFKVLIVYLLFKINYDKLIIYALLLFVVSIIINGFYVLYCLLRYRRLQIRLDKDKTDYKEVFSFLNWNLIGAVASVCKGQGINIIMNMFFGGVINAARGIAFQVNNVVTSFSQNFMKAVDPQITKTCANNNEEKLTSLIYTSSKLSFFLLYIVALPLIANMNYVLTLWLEKVPTYTIEFTILALIDALIMSITDPIFTAVQATGKIKNYQIIVGGLALMNLPVAYVLLKVFRNPVIPFFVSIVISICMAFARLFMYKKIVTFSVSKYVLHVFLPLFIVTLISSAFTFFVGRNTLTFIKFVYNVLIIVVFTAITIFVIGLNKKERNLLLNILPINKHRKDNK